MHLTSGNLKIQPVKRDHAAIPLGQPRSTQHQAFGASPPDRARRLADQEQARHLADRSCS